MSPEKKKQAVGEKMAESNSVDSLPPGWTMRERIRESGKRDKVKQTNYQNVIFFFKFPFGDFEAIKVHCFKFEIWVLAYSCSLS